jgi:hypothetical protein
MSIGLKIKELGESGGVRMVGGEFERNWGAV